MVEVTSKIRIASVNVAAKSRALKGSWHIIDEVTEIVFLWVSPKIGMEEGEPCNRDGCKGVIGFGYEDSCRCFSMRMPPCGPCSSAYLECTTCGWIMPDEDEIRIFLKEKIAPKLYW